MIDHAIHYIPVGEQDGHVPTTTCICSPEAGSGSYTHRRSYEFGWTFPCCGEAVEARIYGGPDGPSEDDLRDYVDAFPHDCTHA